MRRATPTHRLTREDWLDAGLRALAQDGVAAVRVKPLAEELGVTHPSFYWHFESRAALRTALLEHWIEHFTLGIRNRTRGLGGSAGSRILALMRGLSAGEHARYDIAVRAWASHDDVAAAYVRKADRIRLDYVSGLFGELGFDALHVEMRARTLVYYHSMEPSFLACETKRRRDELLALRFQLLTGLRAEDVK